MNNQEIVAQLSLLTRPADVLHEITMETVISAIVRRMGEEALDLSAEDLELARNEVKAAIEHHLDERDCIDMGLDAWEIGDKYLLFSPAPKIRGGSLNPPPARRIILPIMDSRTLCQQKSGRSTT